MFHSHHKPLGSAVFDPYDQQKPRLYLKNTRITLVFNFSNILIENLCFQSDACNPRIPPAPPFLKDIILDICTDRVI